MTSWSATDPSVKASAGLLLSSCIALFNDGSANDSQLKEVRYLVEAFFESLEKGKFHANEFESLVVELSKQLRRSVGDWQRNRQRRDKLLLASAGDSQGTRVVLCLMALRGCFMMPLPVPELQTRLLGVCADNGGVTSALDSLILFATDVSLPEDRTGTLQHTLWLIDVLSKGRLSQSTGHAITPSALDAFWAVLNDLDDTELEAVAVKALTKLCIAVPRLGELLPTHVELFAHLQRRLRDGLPLHAPSVYAVCGLLHSTQHAVSPFVEPIERVTNCSIDNAGATRSLNDLYSILSAFDGGVEVGARLALQAGALAALERIAEARQPAYLKADDLYAFLASQHRAEAGFPINGEKHPFRDLAAMLSMIDVLRRGNVHLLGMLVTHESALWKTLVWAAFCRHAGLRSAALTTLVNFLGSWMHAIANRDGIVDPRRHNAHIRSLIDDPVPTVGTVFENLCAVVDSGDVEASLVGPLGDLVTRLRMFEETIRNNVSETVRRARLLPTTPLKPVVSFVGIDETESEEISFTDTTVSTPASSPASSAPSSPQKNAKKKNKAKSRMPPHQQPSPLVPPTSIAFADADGTVLDRAESAADRSSLYGEQGTANDTSKTEDLESTGTAPLNVMSPPHSLRRSPPPRATPSPTLTHFGGTTDTESLAMEMDACVEATWAVIVRPRVSEQQRLAIITACLQQGRLEDVGRVTSAKSLAIADLPYVYTTGTPLVVFLSHFSPGSLSVALATLSSAHAGTHDDYSVVSDATSVSQLRAGLEVHKPRHRASVCAAPLHPGPSCLVVNLTDQDMKLGLGDNLLEACTISPLTSKRSHSTWEMTDVRVLSQLSTAQAKEIVGVEVGSPYHADAVTTLTNAPVLVMCFQGSDHEMTVLYNAVVERGLTASPSREAAARQREVLFNASTARIW